MPSPTTVELSYAPRPRRRRSRRRVALLSVLVVLAVAAVVARKWEKAAWQQGVYLYWQHRCMTYTAPADKIVYEDDPVVATKLIATGANYYPPGRLLFDESWWPTPPRSWRPPALYAAPELERLSVAYPTERCGTLFVHERRTIGGIKKLVVVWIGCASFGPNEHYVVLSGEAITPARFAIGSTVIRSRYGPDISLRLKSSDHLQVFAGRPDQKEASRFAIAYLLNGKPGVIEGELMDAGHWRHDRKVETLRLHLTDGPLLPDLIGGDDERDWQ